MICELCVLTLYSGSWEDEYPLGYGSETKFRKAMLGLALPAAWQTHGKRAVGQHSCEKACGAKLNQQ